ncbi:MAG: PepSY domain-containing protein [Mucilaginibacter polytrichastri]|nr:PepSY domain-containing protein [Mucilaginibacter polytrichastri]
MDNRRYNIYFHTHTISGIIICAVLYVIFFAGSFSFFKSEISAWQKNNSYTAALPSLRKDYNHILDSLGEKHNLRGRDFDFTLQRNGVSAYVSMSATHDSTLKPKPDPAKAERAKGRGRRGRDGDAAYFTYDFSRQKALDYAQGYDMGEFLYRLHFLAQLNAVPIRLGTPFGYLLAGIVSFMFLFALITGLLLHWNKIVSNFFTFRPWNKWKTVWTDMHTALGVIGFPFQLVFAITGVILIANVALTAPYTRYAYNNDSEKLFTNLEYYDNTPYEYSYKPLNKAFNLNGFIAGIERQWHGTEVNQISIRNFQDDNMHVIVRTEADPKLEFAGFGKQVYRMRDGKILVNKVPDSGSTYIGKVKSLIYHLHFGDFGGRPLRVVFFILGAMGCLVIISGILIWLVARDKNNVPAHKRKFNFWAANVFLSACLAMLPVTAFTMIVLMVVKEPTQDTIYHWYFYSWLVLGLYFVVRKDFALTTRQTTLLSAVLCLALPVADGLLRQNWLWTLFSARAFDILSIHILFLVLSLISFVSYGKILKEQAKEEITAAAPTQPVTAGIKSAPTGMRRPPKPSLAAEQK